MKVIYVAGPFRAATPWLIEQNVRRAEIACLDIWRMGMVPICPHTQTRYFQGSAPDAAFLDGTLEMMRRCDAILVLSDWAQSDGTKGEIKEADRLGLPVFYRLSSLSMWKAGAA